MQTSVKKRSVVVAGHRTSISLERVFWDGLRQLATARGRTVNQMVSEIDARRPGNLSSAIRVFVLQAACEGRLQQPEGLTGSAAAPAVAAVREPPLRPG